MKWMLLMLLVPLSGAAQTFTNLSRDNTVFQYSNEFSALFAYNNHLYLPSERCKSVVKLNMDGTYADSFPLQNSNAEIQIEGACVFGKYVIFLDETANQTSLYFYKIDRMRFVCSVLLKYEYTDDKYGVEGIAVNKNICYILRERNHSNQSIIRQYKIEPLSDGKFGLSYKEGMDVIITHPESKKVEHRYSDLFFSDKTLYLLRSYFVEINSRCNEYYIDTIRTVSGQDFLPAGEIKDIPTLLYKDLSKDMRQYEDTVAGSKPYSTNLEGLTFYNNEIYLVTDNGGQGNKCGRPSKMKTLLVKFKKPG